MAEKVKVSVVVATYAPGAGLQRVIDSLDAQTLPQAEFETLFVDDGSPDDTVARLEAFAATRPNMRVTSIANSGWPSRPRNVGLDRAVGEFVTFMDHDDELFPQALESAFQFAKRHDADVVNTKETVTSDWFWGYPIYLHDLPPGDEVTPEHLMPMRPHKLYSRKLLREHDIRFREGRRVIFEDVYFNIDVLAHARRVGVSSAPFYKWVRTGSNNSSSYGGDAHEAWDAFDRIFDQIESAALSRRQRDFMLLHTYRLRVLSMMLGQSMLDRDESWLSTTWERVVDIVERHVPARLDLELNPVTAPRARLVRLGRLDLLRPLAEMDRRVWAALTATTLTWSQTGELLVGGNAVWRQGDDARLPVVGDGTELRRALPGELDAVVGDLGNLTAELRGTKAVVTVKSRRDGVDLAAPTFHRTVVQGEQQEPEVRVEAESRLSLDDAPDPGLLGPGAWGVGCRLEFAGYVSHRAVRYAGPPVAALVRGRPAIAWGSSSGALVVEVGGGSRSVFACSRPDLERATLRRTGLRGYRLRIPVLDLVGVGESRLETRLRLRAGAQSPTVVDASLVAGRHGVYLEARLIPPRGLYRLMVEDLAVRTQGHALWRLPMVLDSRGFRPVLRVRPVRRGTARVWGGPDRTERR